MRVSAALARTSRPASGSSVTAALGGGTVAWSADEAVVMVAVEHGRCVEGPGGVSMICSTSTVDARRRFACSFPSSPPSLRTGSSFAACVGCDRAGRAGGSGLGARVRRRFRAEAGAGLAWGGGEVADVPERGVVAVRVGRRSGGSGGLDSCARRFTGRGTTGEV